MASVLYHGTLQRQQQKTRSVELRAFHFGGDGRFDPPSGRGY
jgi:hypothetical protein